MPGQMLFIDLTDGKIERRPVDRGLLREYLGGRGINARLLWDLTKKGMDPLSPAAPLLFGTGTLAGTFAPNSGRMTITCKSPATGLYLKTNVGSHAAPELRFAGYDYLVFQGKAPHPVYLWIDDGEVTLRDARGLWGLDTRTADRRIKEELGDDQIRTILIGPAGENLVVFASIMASIYRAAGRGGSGAVMGSKNLKVIAVRGTGDATVADPDAFMEVARAARRALRADEYCWTRSFEFGTAQGIIGSNEGGTLPHHNFQDGRLADAYKLSGEFVSEKYARPEACSACVFHCGRFARVKSGPYAGTYTGGPEYETLASLGSKCGTTDTAAIIKAGELCNVLGMDTISAGSLVSFAMECTERGLLSPEDADGLDLSWGNVESMLTLLERMARREGLGDLLANGSRAAAKTIGHGAEAYAIQAKGLEQSMVDVRGTMSYALAFALNPRGPDHLTTECLAEVGYTPEVRRLAEEITGTPKATDSLSADGKPRMVAWHEEIYAVTDCLGICAFTDTWSYTRVNFENMAAMFAAATRIPLTADEARGIGERIITLERLFNLREGLTRDQLDVLPERMVSEPSPTLRSGARTLTQEKLDGMLREYYALRKWNPKTGVPLRETLARLDLGFAADEVIGAR
ncbi:MAG: aldehyde ferredoxin oxidoreductase family protein [Candidatus Bipolaricaulota bacterium]|nr:aldehyde ferredoxin oxidoreductase family protein [Candidatus Bipolaricaulota bacterium]